MTQAPVKRSALPMIAGILFALVALLDLLTLIRNVSILFQYVHAFTLINTITAFLSMAAFALAAVGCFMRNGLFAGIGFGVSALSILVGGISGLLGQFTFSRILNTLPSLLAVGAAVTAALFLILGTKPGSGLKKLWYLPGILFAVVALIGLFSSGARLVGALFEGEFRYLHILDVLRSLWSLFYGSLLVPALEVAGVFLACKGLLAPGPKAAPRFAPQQTWQPPQQQPQQTWQQPQPPQQSAPQQTWQPPQQAAPQQPQQTWQPPQQPQ
ncbi:MAG: hypothetical protein II776_00380 [Clostridia bacterium]|nr:hypothetical protein [Clostridia bacterium]